MTPITASLPALDPLRLNLFARSTDTARQALARAARDDFPDWLAHVGSAAQCTRPVRLAGTITTYHGTGVGTATDPVTYSRSTWDTSALPDGVLYKRCGNRRAAVCPACSKIYQRDAYQIVRAGIVGGHGVPESVAQHQAMFTTLTAPGFGTVHNRVVRRHTCGNRSRCDCRAEICHPRRDHPTCEHGTVQACWARHDNGDKRVGKPICGDCYDYDTHVVWNSFAGELWRRTKQAIDRELSKLCRAKKIPRVVVGVNPRTGRPVTKSAAQVSCGKAGEFQMRGVVHFHALIRLDGRDPDDPKKIVPPPDGLTVRDLETAIVAAVRSQGFDTPPHPDAPEGWRIQWGTQLDNRPVSLSGHGEVTDEQVARYLAKYATKSTEVTGHSSARLTEETVGRYADVAGSHVQRLVAACWRIGRPHKTELLQQAYARLLSAIGATGAELGHLAPDDTSAQAPIFDRLHRTIGDLVDVAEAVPGRHRPKHVAPASGAVKPWICPACATPSRHVQCQTCLAQQRNRAQRHLRLLFLLLLLGEIQAPHPDEPNPYAGLRRWAHMLGFGGHFFTQSARYSVTFRIKREERITFRRNENPASEAEDADADRDGEETVVVVNSLSLAGIGWHTTADAMLAQTASALAREHQQLARHLIMATPI
ncbi:MAG TPA: replication initiator [Candidatus Limnocylindrales bacterium]